MARTEIRRTNLFDERQTLRSLATSSDESIEGVKPAVEGPFINVLIYLAMYEIYYL